MTTCQICGRAIKAKNGIIAHHGYTRPGDGWQTTSCIGARELPYEKSRDVIPRSLTEMTNYIKLQEAIIVEVNKGVMPMPFMNGLVDNTRPTYKIRQGEYIAKLEWQIKLAQMEVERLQARYDNWKVVA